MFGGQLLLLEHVFLDRLLDLQYAFFGIITILVIFDRWPQLLVHRLAELSSNLKLLDLLWNIDLLFLFRIRNGLFAFPILIVLLMGLALGRDYAAVSQVLMTIPGRIEAQSRV